MYMQLNIEGTWDPVDKNDIDMDEVADDSFDVCPVCGNNPCTCGFECPLGGDLSNDCADCADRADYHFDPVLQDCVLNESEDKKNG